MAVMSDIHGDLIYSIMDETGFEYDYVAEKFEEAQERGVSPIDFFDEMVDSKAKHLALDDILIRAHQTRTPIDLYELRRKLDI